MKIIIFITALLCWANPVSAEVELEVLLAQLNREIDNKPFHDLQKERRIGETKRLLQTPHLLPAQEYDYNHNLAELNKKYLIDSAIYYTEKNRRLAMSMNRPDLLSESNLRLSLLYSMVGMYIESKEILDNVNRQALPEKLLPLYFEANALFCGHYAQSNGQHIYFKGSENYSDSLLAVLDKTGLPYKIAYAEKLFYKGELELTEKHLLDIFNQLWEEHDDYALITYLLGNLYQKKQNAELQKKYLIMSAIADIKNSIKDNASLRGLALIYYESDDVDLAYKFMKSAIDDMMFCNVRFRAIELSIGYSIINTAYLTKETNRKRELQSYLVLISMLSAFLIVAVLLVYTQMRKVSRIRKKLYTANLQLVDLNQSISLSNNKLHKTNALLSESNRIKEEYIAHFFDICSDYINKLEDYRKTLNKKATANQHEELFKLLKSTNFVDDERQKLYETFDTIFLNLYPGFVDEFNALLAKEEQIVPKPGELLNTELRIFALIRLGINDTVKIAGFLRYSMSTIYNYRTKIKNKAVARDEFEEMVMKIGILRGK